ncbi:MAG: hypothetical protein E6I70_07730 [Chloroflexi bacterium]|nr:MAG: hypothetical protein E6I70_07730 [Chloroflexota bacterium]TME19327.1 MAG: hypothetical protein E6I63_00375 [Chloroflexota bacterium]
MASQVTVSELASRAADLLTQLASGGEPIVIVDENGRRIALLVPHGEPLGPLMEAIDKSEFGFNPSAGVIGSTSGREQLSSELRDMGMPVPDGEGSVLEGIYAAVLELCEEKETVYREDLRKTAEEVLAEAPGRIKLLALSVQTTSGMPATAEVTLELGSGPAMRRQQGDGPLDAAINAMEKLTGLEPTVDSFAAFSATPGRDALAEAVIELTLGGETVMGRGASSDTVAAGVRAYLNALNFLQTTVARA